MRNLALSLLVILALAAFVYASFWLSENTVPELLTPTPENANNTKPYFHFRFTTTPEIPENTPVPEKTPVLVRVESVNVHSRPSLHAPVVGWVYQNDEIHLEFCDNGWAHINYPVTGFVNGTCLDPNPCGEPGSCK